MVIFSRSFFPPLQTFGFHRLYCFFSFPPPSSILQTSAAHRVGKAAERDKKKLRDLDRATRVERENDGGRYERSVVPANPISGNLSVKCICRRRSEKSKGKSISVGNFFFFCDSTAWRASVSRKRRKKPKRYPTDLRGRLWLGQEKRIISV